MVYRGFSLEEFGEWVGENFEFLTRVITVFTLYHLDIEIMLLASHQSLTRCAIKFYRRKVSLRASLQRSSMF